MKLKMYLALLAMGMLSLQGCNDDDDDLPNSKVPEAVRNAFDSSFSNTANLSWETKTVSQGQYYKAEFNNMSDNGYKTEACIPNWRQPICFTSLRSRRCTVYIRLAMTEGSSSPSSVTRTALPPAEGPAGNRLSMLMFNASVSSS